MNKNISNQIDRILMRSVKHPESNDKYLRKEIDKCNSILNSFQSTAVKDFYQKRLKYFQEQLHLK